MGWSKWAGLAVLSAVVCAGTALVWINTPEKSPRAAKTQSVDSGKKTPRAMAEGEQHPVGKVSAIHQQSPEKKEKAEDALARYTWWLTGFTGILAGATVALAFYTWRLYRTTFGLHHLAENQEKITEILQRAYIGVEPDGIRPYRRRSAGSDSPHDLTGHFDIRNVGNLPARQVSWSVQITCDSRRDWHDFRFEEGEFVGNMVAIPGVRIRRATRIIRSTEFLPPVGATERYCYVWGRIRYRDGLDVLQTTDFCHRYNCEALRDNKTIPPEYARYHECGNEAT